MMTRIHIVYMSFCHIYFCPNGHFANPKPTCKSKSRPSRHVKALRPYTAWEKALLLPPSSFLVRWHTRSRKSWQGQTGKVDGLKRDVSLMAYADNLIIWAADFWVEVWEIGAVLDSESFQSFWSAAWMFWAYMMKNEDLQRTPSCPEVHLRKVGRNCYCL